MGNIFSRVTKSKKDTGNASTATLGAPSYLLAANLAVSLAINDQKESAEDGAEITSLLDDLDAGMERVEGGLKAINACSIGSGVKPALSSESLGILSETLLNDVGIVATGLESSSTLGPVEVTEEASCGLESMAGDLFESMRESFYKFLEWIAKHFNKLFGTVESIKAAAGKLKDAESDFDGSTSKDHVKVKLSKLVTGITDKTVTSNLADGLKTLGELSGETVAGIEDKARLTFDDIATQLDKPIADWTPVDSNTPSTALTSIQTAFSGTLTACTNAIGSSGNKAILGGREIVELKDADVTYDKGSRVRFELKGPTTKVESKEVKPLERSEIANICDELIDVCDTLLNGRKKITDTKKFKSKFTKLSASAEKMSKDSDFSEVRTDIRVVGKLATSMGLIANGSIRNTLTTHTISVMEEVLSYAQKSLKKA